MTAELAVHSDFAWFFELGAANAACPGGDLPSSRLTQLVLERVPFSWSTAAALSATTPLFRLASYRLNAWRATASSGGHTVTSAGVITTNVPVRVSADGKSAQALPLYRVVGSWRDGAESGDLPSWPKGLPAILDAAGRGEDDSDGAGGAAAALELLPFGADNLEMRPPVAQPPASFSGDGSIAPGSHFLTSLTMPLWAAEALALLMLQPGALTGSFTPNRADRSAAMSWWEARKRSLVAPPLDAASVMQYLSCGAEGDDELLQRVASETAKEISFCVGPARRVAAESSDDSVRGDFNATCLEDHGLLNLIQRTTLQASLLPSMSAGAPILTHITLRNLPLLHSLSCFGDMSSALRHLRTLEVVGLDLEPTGLCGIEQLANLRTLLLSTIQCRVKRAHVVLGSVVGWSPSLTDVRVERVNALDMRGLASSKVLSSLWMSGSQEVEWDDRPGFAYTRFFPDTIKVLSFRNTTLTRVMAHFGEPMAEPYPNLEEIDFSGWSVQTLDPLCFLPRLKIINCSGCFELEQIASEATLKLIQMSRLMRGPAASQSSADDGFIIFPSLEVLHLQGTSITSSMQLDILATLPRLRTCFLPRCFTSGAPLTRLALSRSIEELHLHENQIDDGDVAGLALAPSLRKLFLSQTDVSGDLVTALQGDFYARVGAGVPDIHIRSFVLGINAARDTADASTFALEVLHLSYCKGLTTAGLMGLHRFTKLRRLKLVNCVGLKALSPVFCAVHNGPSMPNLVELHIDRCGLQGPSSSIAADLCKALGALPRLEILSMLGVEVEDATWMPPSCAGSLRKLSAHFTVSLNGLERLKRLEVLIARHAAKPPSGAATAAALDFSAIAQCAALQYVFLSAPAPLPACAADVNKHMAAIAAGPLAASIKLLQLQNIAVSDIGALGPSCTALRILSLVGQPTLRSSGLRGVERCPRIHTLRLQDCRQIADSICALDFLRSAERSMRLLDLRKVGRIAEWIGDDAQFFLGPNIHIIV